MADKVVALAGFQELSEAHGALLEAQSDDKLNPSAVSVFITEAAAAGVQIESIAERDALRSMINYWTAVLSRLPRAPDAPVAAPAVGPTATTPERPTLARFDATALPDLPDEDNPFVGLAAFDQGQRGLFYGRDGVISDLLARCVADPFLVVSGASGTGKSSLVRAGLVSTMRSDPHYADWLIAVASPGRDPLASLITALAPQGADASNWIDHARKRVDEDPAALAAIAGERMGNGHLLLVVDQFEEMFSLCEEAPRDRAVAGLAAIVKLPNAHVVITIRDEYLEGERRRHRLPPGLDFDAEHEFRIPPLSSAEIRAAIEGPAMQAGLFFQDGLIDRIIADVGSDPAALPLLQYTLLRLWQKRQGNRVTNEIYDAIGGITASLSCAAQEIYDSLGTEQAQNNVRVVFEQLVRPSLAYEFVRDRVTRGELQTLLPPESLNTVLTPYEKASLLRITRTADRSDDRIEIVHEALIRNWDLLRRWSLEGREQERAYLSLDAQATQWSESGRKIGNLLFGRALHDAEAVRAAYEAKRIRSDPVTKRRVDTFLAECRVRQSSLVRWSTTVVSIIILVLLFLGLWLSYVITNGAIAARTARIEAEAQERQLGQTDAIIAKQRASLVAQGGPLVGESARQFIQMLLSRGTISRAELPIEFADMSPVAPPWPIAEAGAHFDEDFLGPDAHVVPEITTPGVRKIDLPHARIFYDTISGMPLLVASQSDRSQPQINNAPNGLYAYPGLAGQPDEPKLAAAHIILVHLVDRREVGWNPNGLWAAKGTNSLPMMVRMPERTRADQPFGPWLKLGQWLRGNHNPTAPRVIYLSGAVPPADRTSKLAAPTHLWKIAVSLDANGGLVVDAAMLPAKPGAKDDVPGRTTLATIASVTGIDFSALMRASTGPRPASTSVPSAAAKAATAPTQIALPPRIYASVHGIPDDQAAQILLSLANAGFRIPPIEQVAACVDPQLRYYYDEDGPAAQRAAAAANDAIKAAGLTAGPVQVRHLSLKQFPNARPDRFELWICGTR